MAVGRADRPSLLWPGVLVGIGLAGTLDEVVLHQLLAWHHFYDRSTPTAGLVSDGLFHVFSTVVLVVGIIQLVERRRTTTDPPRVALAGILLGAGGFNLYDGTIQHKLLRLHQVREGVPNNLPYDLADLVEAEELVLDGAVVEVEAAGAQEDAGEGEAGWVGAGAAALDQLDDADDQDGGAEQVEQAVGDEADGGGRAVVEVVPGQELVQDDLVEGAGDADADQDAGPEQRPVAAAVDGQSHHLLVGGGSHAIRRRKPGVSGGW